MKHFIVSWQTNYGLSVMLINIEDEERARIYAKENGAWPGFDIEEIDLTQKGIVFQASS